MHIGAAYAANYVGSASESCREFFERMILGHDMSGDTTWRYKAFVDVLLVGAAIDQS